MRRRCAIVTLAVVLGLLGWPAPAELQAGLPGPAVAHAAEEPAARPERLRGPLGPVPAGRPAAAVHTVCPGGPPDCEHDTIQGAVDAAAPGDLIKVAGGVYSGVQGRPSPPEYLGTAVVTQVVYLSKTVTIRGGYTTANGFADPPDPRSNPTTLDARGQGRVLFIGGAISPTVEGLRITEGNATGQGGEPAADQAGGGVYVLGAAATISGSRIYGNTAGSGGSGGGIFLYRSESTLRGNTILANSANMGGGVYLWSSDAWLDGNVVNSNTAGRQGGGLQLYDSNATLTGNTIATNQADIYGGGAYQSGGVVLFEGNLFRRNEARYGGGMQVRRGNGTTLRGNTFTFNDAWAGGAMYLQYSGWDYPIRLVSNTISLNTGIWGGGVWLMYANCTFTQNEIIANTAERGGGLAGFSSDSFFDRNTFSANQAYSDGGALQLESTTPVLRDNLFAGNSAYNGGALHLYGNAAIVQGNTFRSNSAHQGGGVYLWYNTATLSSNTVISNSADYGGGLWLYQSDGALLGNIITSNTAITAGGGIGLRDSDALLTNNLVADNQAGQGGGGVYVAGSAPLLRHNTIVRNRGEGSGVWVVPWGASASTVALTDTILVSHTVGISVSSGCKATLEATLWGSGAWGNGTDWSGSGAIVTGTVNIWGDPAFVDPVQGDYHIGQGSAAIDAGVAAGVAVDIDGEPRPFGQRYDIGADEYPAGVGVRKEASAEPVAPGVVLTYTLTVSNSGQVALSATIVDVLPAQVSPTGLLSWTAEIAAGAMWTETVVVAVMEDYAGALVNVVGVTTDQGVTGAYTCTVTVEEPIAGLAASNDSPTALGDPTTLSATVTAGSAVSYSWSFGDGQGGSGAVASRAYGAAGAYTAVVTASNGVSLATARTVVSVIAVTPAYRLYLPLVLRSGTAAR